jgi:leucyl aminopeptidase
MNQEWNHVEFKFGNDHAAAYDLAVVDFGSRQSLNDLLKNHPHAKNALADEFKKLKKDDEANEESATPKVIKIPYEGKGGLHAVIVSGNPSAYLIQNAIRSAFGEIFTNADEARAVNVSLKGLKDARAKEVLGWVSSLATLTRFQAAVFGQREKEVKKAALLTVNVQTNFPKAQAEAAIEEGRILGFCNNQVRYLADLPSNILNPRTYRDRAEKIAKELKVDFEFLDVKKLQKKGAGAFLAVVAADHNERGGIVHLHYTGKKSKKKVAIVGKGICFDTGGYNVKVGEYMYNMHRDMTGSAVALSLFRALVEMEAPYEVHAYLALAENLISHEGYRPNDVVTASNGLSIEVIDTDAEGRMVLSDTLAIASEEKPDFILDFATLTGSVVRAIDTRRCGAYSNEPRVGRLAVEVGDRCGERVWNFPIGDDYFESLKSETADIRQCSSSGSADHIYAATFLSKFVGKKIPWVHVDLAADTNKGGLGLVATETTGFGVRFGLTLIREMLK